MFSKKFIGKIKQKMDSIADPVQFMSDLMAAKNQKTKASYANYFKEIQAINAEQDIAKKEQKMGDFFADYVVAYGLKRMIGRNDENFQKISSLYNSADIYGDLDQMGFDDELSDLGELLEDSDTEWDEYLEAANQVGEEAEPEAKEEEQPKAEDEKEADEPKVEDEKEVNNAPVNDFMDDEEEPEAEEKKENEANNIASDEEEEKEAEVIQPVEQADNSVEISTDKEPIQEKDDATIEIVPEKQQEPVNEEPANEEPVNEGPKPKYTQYLGNISLKTTMVRQTRTVMNSFDGQPNEYYAFAKQRLNKVQEEYENDGFKDFREKLGVYTYLKKVHDGRKGMEWFKNIFTSIKERILMGKIEKSLKNDYGLNGDTLKEIYDNANEKLVFEQRENGIYCDTVANIESERNALQNNAPEAPQEQAEELNQEQFRKDVNMSISDLPEGEKSISESIPESQLNISKDSEKSV